MSLREQLAFARARLRRRDGHKPGWRDVTDLRTEYYFATTARGYEQRARQYFMAYPNFYYFSACGRPCYLPLNPALRIGGPDWAVTEGWPCEFRTRHDRSSGPYCYSRNPGRKLGERVKVIGQLRGQPIRNDIGQVSDIWDVIWLPKSLATRNQHLLREAREGQCYYAYAPDMWLGNIGVRDWSGACDSFAP